MDEIKGMTVPKAKADLPSLYLKCLLFFLSLYLQKVQLTQWSRQDPDTSSLDNSHGPTWRNTELDSLKLLEGTERVRTQKPREEKRWEKET